MIAFFSNFLNHHQVLIADELYKYSNKKFIFVTTSPLPKAFQSNGYIDFDSRPYILATYKGEKEKEEAKLLAKEADVVFFGANSFMYEICRMNCSTPGLTFEVSERWLKKGWINLLSPRLLKNILYYHIHRWKNKPLYKLCSSAFAAADQYKLHTFKNRCYKWGYFTKVEKIDIETIINQRENGQIKLMWCARFINWKHPELPVKLAKKLKDDGCKFHLDMFGQGPKLDKIKKLCKNLNVEEFVSFKGTLPNDDILAEMRQHDIFLFTSDQNEGWGAVLNEAMSNGCTVVVSDKIGAAPFLIKDGENGIIFKSENLESLYTKTKFLIQNEEKKKQIAINAYNDMVNIWSPEVAAKNLLSLISKLQIGEDTSIQVGPCSKAYPI